MSIRLSEHLMLADTPLTPLSLITDTPNDLTITLPTGFIDTAGNQPILSFRLGTSGDVAGLTFTVSSSNDAFVTTALEFTGTYDSSVAHSVQEVITTGSLVAGSAGNRLRIAYTGGTGTLTISDVALLVKRPAAEINTGVGGTGG